MTNYEADGYIVTLEDTGQNSESNSSCIYFPKPQHRSTEASTEHALVEILNNKPNQNAVKYQRPVTLLADASLLFSFPQDFNYLLIPPGKSVS